MTLDKEPLYWKSNREWYRINHEKNCYELTDQAPERAVRSFELYRRGRSTASHLIYVGKYEELSPGHGHDSMKAHLSPTPYARQNEILHYLKTRGTRDMVSMKTPRDVFTGEIISGGMIGYNDGRYTWWSTLIYYVEKYNLRLPTDFEAHILNHPSIEK